jgi:hypothetical protein
MKNHFSPCSAILIAKLFKRVVLESDINSVNKALSCFALDGGLKSPSLDFILIIILQSFKVSDLQSIKCLIR